MFMSGGRVLLLGVVATAVMDILSTLARKAHVVAPLPPTLLGRWVASMARGHVRHASIEQAVPVGHEFVIALLAHYAVGVVFASLYLFATSRLDMSPGSAGAAITFGLATCHLSHGMLYAHDPGDVRVWRPEVPVSHLPMKWAALGILSCLAFPPAMGSESRVTSAAIVHEARAVAPQAIAWRRDIHEHRSWGTRRSVPQGWYHNI
jgi:hypothetical protein